MAYYMSYYMFFDSVLMPVTPEEVKAKIKNLNKTVNLINEGEINMLKLPGLTEFSFTLLLPNIKGYPFARYLGSDFRNAQYYLDLFELHKTSKRPFSFILTRMFPDGKPVSNDATNTLVSLEDYTFSDSVKNGFDVNVDINLKIWVNYGTRIGTVQQPADAQSPPTVAVQNNRPNDPSKIAVGAKVIVSGQLYRDSYGSGPGKVLSAYNGVVNIINEKGSFPYHISDPGGGWLGWVAASSVTGVS